MIKLRRILVPTDFSQNARAALEYAQQLAEQNDAELDLLYVMEDLNHLMTIPDFGAVGIDLDAIRRSAEAELQGLIDPAWEKTHTVHRTIRAGSPFLEILRHAREKEIDLIVMSTHGRTGLTHLLLGSVAENVVRKSSCPVLTVRPEGQKSAAAENGV